MLAYYVERHMYNAWAPLLFAEDDPHEAHKRRGSPVKPAVRSQSAKRKTMTRKTPQELPEHSFRGLLGHMATLVRNTHRPLGGGATFEQMTIPTKLQRRAFELLGIKPRL